MKIIPAIDIIEGKCVRLTKGDYNTKIIYNENPLEVALAFEDAGMREEVKIMVGGAPVTQEFADEMGADAYGANAVDCVQKAKDLSTAK